MSSCGLTLAPPAKTVVVYRNGDPFFPGRKFVVNQRRFPTFEAFLNEVTESIGAPLAVRNLYTPKHGHRVAALGDLQEGCQYVAAGFEKFRKLNYLNRGKKEIRGTRNSEGLQVGSSGKPEGRAGSARWRRGNSPGWLCARAVAVLLHRTRSLVPHRSSLAVEQLGAMAEAPPPAPHDTVSVFSLEGLWEWVWRLEFLCKILGTLPHRDNSQLLPEILVNMASGWLFFPTCCRNTVSPRALGCFHRSVFRNGDLLSPPFPLSLSTSTPLQWDTLLATLTGKANLRSGAVSKLCRLDGTQVSSEEELVNGDYYVAVGNEEYKKLPYLELLVPQDSVGRTLWNHPNSRRKKYHRRFGELCATSQISAGDSALAEPPQQLDSHRVQTTGAAEKDAIPAALPRLQRQGGKSHLKEFIFHAKPVRAGRNRRSSRNVQHWPDQEESVYKTRDPRKEMRGAQEVKDDEHTRADVPTDQARTSEKSPKAGGRKRDASDSEDGKHPMMLPLAAKSSEELTKGLRWEKRDD
ncbi:doublecortin domain-containing protein 2B [Athene cunicularia]|uniref:doublecortin domain-containing protein 2B n=1 Tax=Athene cunicularia TaxID=194338 RepID=UPI000EF64E7F|nr:doublecortin domain-containing protein 2B [Athene cunicularia]